MSVLRWQDLPAAPAAGTVICHLDAVADGHPELFEFPAVADGGKPFRLVLLRSGDALHAFVNRCAHFGVPLAERREHLIFKPHLSLSCNVHYARYRWHDGYCEAGDCAGESLIPVAVVCGKDGLVRIA